MTIIALIEAIFGSPSHPLAAWYGGLLAEDALLRAFSSANVTKMRRKVRHARDSEAQRDLRCELALAAALGDQRSPLTYEPLAAKGRRGPDFLLHYQGHTAVYVEVTRLRPARSEAHEAGARLAAFLCGKLNQLVAGAANLLVVVSDAAPYTSADVGAAIDGLRRRAAAGDNAYFAFRSLAGAGALRQFLPRLSAVLIVLPNSEALFVQQQARHPLPSELVQAIPTWQLALRLTA